jgi:hypothetical protein
VCFFSTDWLFAIRKPSETVSSGDKHSSPQVTEIYFSSVDAVIAAGVLAAAIHPSIWDSGDWMEVDSGGFSILAHYQAVSTAVESQPMPMLSMSFFSRRLQSRIFVVKWSIIDYKLCESIPPSPCRAQTDVLLNYLFVTEVLVSHSSFEF